ncbi:MAG: amino acid ABC transporter substrate-binding protein [Bacteroidetes bacterium]|nr:amino acid ABC transporter substrate-binding protein [Bacteroidota bacterium]MBU1371907.1 amino acid ABC transporter substrate-binding protein [Bacteroidota bacterium]MBU1483509.1 amino acid ABC transporter substrate-binding protein [Bacteroidota bacterium]MBU1761037.1 amino acid ABC transporter substrate-binding protein [Bacteroidota bacterium]MBU2269218.1 amino acid ABC transporter substrate-binding protein [Bacteroidota bacterium]
MILVLNRLQRLSGNKIIGIFLLGMFLSACSPKTAPTKKGPTPAPDKQKEEPVIKELEPSEKTKSPEEMIISLILPFDLGAVNYQNANLSDMKKSEIAIDFYQGFKMGVDSVAHQNAKVNYKLQLFDSKDDPTQLANLAAKGAIKASNLIVGPVFPNGIKTFSIYSRNLKIPMVSPLAASDPYLFQNPYLVSINNSLDQHAFKAASFIKQKLKPKKVVLIRSGQADEYKYAVPFKKGMDSLAKGIPVSEIGIKAVGMANVFKYLSPTGSNVVVLPATDRLFLTDIFKELIKLSETYQITLVGHPGWERASFLDYRIMERLNAYTTSSYQVNYKYGRSAVFIKNYRSKFQLEPSEYAVKGFDIGYYFASLMNEKGKEFMSLVEKENYDGIHNDFAFVKDSKTGYYNSSLMVMKFESGQLKKVN